MSDTMTIKIHPDSHTDHAIPDVVRDYVLAKFSSRDAFFIETVQYPAFVTERAGLIGIDVQMPEIPCGLHLDVPESEVHYAKRGDRPYESRLCKRPPRMVREVTIVAGPHPDDADAGMVLFTMYGGPVAPKEPNDPRLTDDERDASTAFWQKAALSDG